MSDLDIRSMSSDDEVLLLRKQVQVGGKEVETPTAAIPIKKTTRRDQLRPEARGVNEIYRQISAGDLRKERRGTGTKKLAKRIHQCQNKALPGELNILLTSYQSDQRFEQDNLEYLAAQTVEGSDLAVVSTMPTLLSEMDKEKGVDADRFQIILDNAEAYINEIQTYDDHPPLMGTIPLTDWDYVQKLVDLYLDHGIRAFCFDFRGKKPTASANATLVQPLVRELGMHELMTNSLLYALNATEGNWREGMPIKPGNNLATTCMGFDIIGNNHIGFKAPAEVFEGIEKTSVDIFRKEDFGYHEVDFEDVGQEFPDFTGLNVDRVERRLDKAASKYENLLSAEQMALACELLRAAVEGENVLELLEDKEGITDDLIDLLKEVYEEYQGGSGQSALGEF